MNGLPSIYLASPLGFTTYGAVFARELARLVDQAGGIALDPWSSPVGEDLAALVARHASYEEIAAANARVGAASAALIRACDGILACLDGAAVDDGTAAEIGYGAALGRTIVGYRGDLRTTGDNVASVVNLQIEYFITESGGSIFRKVEDAIAALMEPYAHRRSLRDL